MGVAGAMFAPTVFAVCQINESGSSNYNNGTVLATDGYTCSATVSNYYGNNVAAALGENTILSFTAPTTTLTSNGGQTHVLSIGNANFDGIPPSSGATVEANNLTIIGSSGANSRGVYITGGDGKKNTLNVKNDLLITHTASTGAALDLDGVDAVTLVGGNTTLTADTSNALRNKGDVTLQGTLDIAMATQGIRNSGTIVVNGETTFTGKGSKSEAINNTAGGIITFNGNVSSAGEQTSITNDAATINLYGKDNQFAGNVSNSNAGLLNLSNDQLGNRITIGGNYIGTGGIIAIDTQLGSDDSPTDFIDIKGKASGSTELKVKNVGGTGAQTVQGIHVIQTGSSESTDTFFLKGGYVSAGAYDYSLVLNKLENKDNQTYDNWYLKSQRDPNQPVEFTTPVYTPDIGLYIAAETMGNTLFTSRLEDREGASRYQDLNQKNGNGWIRVYGGKNQFKSMSDQLKTKGNSLVTQLGVGLVSLGEEDQFNLGIMGGYAHHSAKTQSDLTTRTSKIKMDGYSVGAYGTWYAHPVEKRGAYIDTWVLWNDFKNKIDTADQNQYQYDSSGITASIEVGGEYLLNKTGKKNWWIQPQSQLIYQGVHADKFQDAQGVNIGSGSDNLQARMGFKTYVDLTASNGINYRPYLALNYIHNTEPYSVTIYNTDYAHEGVANLGEVKLGVEGRITKNSQVWLNASYVAGGDSTHAYQGNVGWKYNF